MNQKIENNLINMNHKEFKYHSKKIGNIIKRLEKNHFKWYIIHMSALAFTITIFSFVFNSFQNLNNLNKIILYSLLGIVVNSLSLVSFYNSHLYLKMGRSFREMEQKMINDNIVPDYDWKKVKAKLRFNFIYWTSIFFVIIVLFLSVFTSCNTWNKSINESR